MILDKLATHSKLRVENQKKNISLNKIKREALALNINNDFPFEKALREEGMSFICEVKKASPSKGLIAKDFDYINIAREYEKAGASVISVLTEPKYFLGNNKYLKEISENVNIPILRKDFTVDEYQIYEAKVIGASAVLLICAILEEEQLKEYINLAHSLGLSALVEAHSKEEIEMAVKAGARVIGVNNRDLKTFEVDITLSEKLRKYVSEDKIYISESGIKTRLDVKRLEEIHVNGVLIGETFMKSEDKKSMLNILRGNINE